MTLGLQGPSTWVRKDKGQLGNGQSFRARTTQCFAPGWGVQGRLSLLRAELGLPLCGIIPGSTGDRPCRPHTEGARVRGWAGLARPILMGTHLMQDNVLGGGGLQ